MTVVTVKTVSARLWVQVLTAAISKQVYAHQKIFLITNSMLLSFNIYKILRTMIKETILISDDATFKTR